MTLFGYLIVISIHFYDYDTAAVFLSVFSLVLVSIEKIYQTRKTVYDHVSKQTKHLEVRHGKILHYGVVLSTFASVF